MTVQLPIYNEGSVVERLLEAVVALDYPRDRLEIQVLDDSTDETAQLIQRHVALYQSLGYPIELLRRPNRSGYKAGALAYGLQRARGEFIAIFDADFVPPPGFPEADDPGAAGRSFHRGSSGPLEPSER